MDLTINPELRPTVFVGLGGTGLKVLARFRRRIFESTGSPDYWPMYRFLAIDSNKHDLNAGGVEGERGYPLDPIDRINIGLDAPMVTQIFEGLPSAYRHIERWLSNGAYEYKATSFMDGAAQAPAIGRLLFINSISRIRRELNERVEEVGGVGAMTRTTQGEARRQSVDVVIVASLAGGTGAGAFLDCAFLARTLINEDIPVETIRGMLLLPDAFESKHGNDEAKHTRCLANGYAALRQLEYFNRADSPEFNASDWGGVNFPPPGRVDPFNICYLLSRSNGSIIEDLDSMYDLVADALTLTAGNSQQAERMRGMWSNSQDRYHTKIGIYDEARDYQDGGSNDHGYEPPQYIRFRQDYATRYSSLGISSVTMKLPELRRLAAYQLVRKIILAEIGSAPDDDPTVVKSAEARATPLSQRKNFSHELAEEIKQPLAEASRVDGDAQEAAGLHDHVLKVLDDAAEIILAIAGGTEGREFEASTAQKLVGSTREAARHDVQAALDSLDDTWDLERALVELEGVLKRVERYRVKRPDRPAAGRRIALKQWRDMHENGMTAASFLGGVASKIVRLKFYTHLRQQAMARLEYVDALLRELYLQEVIRHLEERVDSIRRMIGRLREWEHDLASDQNRLAGHFNEKRNIVVTGHLAAAGTAPPGDSRVRELEQEIGKTLQSVIHERESGRLRRTRAKLLEDLPAAVRAGQVLKSMRDVLERRDQDDNGSVQLRLIDTAATGVLANLPQISSIFEFCRMREEDLIVHAKAAMSRARVFWPEHPNPVYLRFRTEDGLAGAVQPATNMAVAEHLKTMIEQGRKWDYQTVGEGEPGANPGEIVFVRESHGYTLPSLNCIDDMERAYNALRAKNDLENRHLDRRWIQNLPDLRRLNFEGAMQTVEHRDIAFLAIAIGLFRWSDEAQTFEYMPERHRTHKLGRTFREAGAYFQTQHPPFFHGIREQIDTWFDDLVDQSHKAPEHQKSVAVMLCALELTVELLEQRVYPEHRYGNHDQTIQSPENTMLKRIRRQYIDHTKKCLPVNQDRLRELKEGLRRHLHEFVRFVGPASERLLQIGNGRQPDDRSVLEEAYRLGWFEDDKHQHALDVKMLFHEDGAKVPKAAQFSKFNVDDIGMHVPSTAPAAAEPDGSDRRDPPAKPHFRSEPGASELVTPVAPPLQDSTKAQSSDAQTTGGGAPPPDDFERARTNLTGPPESESGLSGGIGARDEDPRAADDVPE